MGRANAGPLDHLPDPPTDRLGDAPQSVLLGVRTVAGPGIGEGQDSGDRCHDAGGQRRDALDRATGQRSEEHTSELQSLAYLVCRLLLEKKKTTLCSPTYSC